MNKLKILVAVSIFALQTGGSIDSKLVGGEVGGYRLIKRAANDFHEMHGFSISSNLTFISQNTTSVDFYSKTSHIGHARFSAAWYQTVNSNYYVLMHAELQPLRANYSGFLGIKLYKQGRMKSVDLKCQLANGQQNLFSPQPTTSQQYTTYTIGISSDGTVNSSVSFTLGELEVIGNHNITSSLYHSQFKYIGTENTAYKTTYSEQRGAFVFTSSLVPTSINLSMPVLFGVFSSELASVEQPSVVGINLTLSR